MDTRLIKHVQVNGEAITHSDQVSHLGINIDKDLCFYATGAASVQFYQTTQICQQSIKKMQLYSCP